MRILAISTLILALSGCAGMMRTPPAPGDPEATVLEKLGQPNGRHADPAGGQVLEYATGPMGQFTYMAYLGPEGRLTRFDQVLDGPGFGRIQVGKATKPDVLRLIGRPAETSYLSLRDMEVWSYRYKENGVWNSMMHVHFDRAGVVQQMMNGPDPMYERRYRD